MAVYQQLKHSQNGLPTWEGMIPMVMETAGQQEEWTARDLIKAAADHAELPKELREMSYPKQPDNKVVEDRANWAMSDLALSGLLRRPSRGHYRITELGQQLFKKYGLALSKDIIHQQASYLAHQAELKQRKQTSDQNSGTDESSDASADEDDEGAPAIARIDKIQKQIEDYNNDIAAELLERIREADPGFFENLVADLLSAMGYQGPDGTATVTQFTRDGGIDGIINQDPLGTSTVYYQAKRYQASNVVQRPAIQGFFGALSSVHADRGVFISTSSFTEGAQEQAKAFSIVLIDGVKLTNLLLHYHVGVQAKKNYDLFQIDEDYFG